MRTLFIVIYPPVFNNPLRLGQCREPVQVQTLFAEPTVEAFDIGILGRFSRINEVKLHTMIKGPAIQRPTPKLRSVVNGQYIRVASFTRNPFQHLYNTGAWQ